MNRRLLAHCLLAPIVAFSIPLGCASQSPEQQSDPSEEDIGSAEQAVVDPMFNAGCAGAQAQEVHQAGYPKHAPGPCPASAAFGNDDAYLACSATGDRKVKYLTYTCENFVDGTHAWTSYFGCCPSQCSGTGIVYETRPFYGDVSPLQSIADAITRYNHLQVGAPGYGFANLPDTAAFSNQLVNNGVFHDVATHLKVSFIVPEDQAGSWAFRLGADYGYGGTLLLDFAGGSGFELDSYWDPNPNDAIDFYWSETFSDPDVLQGSRWIGPGIHQIDTYGFENGLDGHMRLEYMAPGTGDPANWQDPAWKVFSSQNLNLCDSSCVGAANGTACDDGNACTQTDTCQNGVCTGANPKTCAAPDQCHTAGACNPATGACSIPNKPNGTSCNDGNACTQTDTCQNGVCAGANPKICAAIDQCHSAGACNSVTGACSNPIKPNGTVCNDGNACTQTDTCQAGVCTGANPKTCAALDQCHSAGVCSPATGVCSNPNKPNGAACNDGNACTQTDTCQAGACAGANPVVCAALDQCHSAGVCSPATGVCSNPNKPNGSACSDGNSCTPKDTCNAGVCTGSNPCQHNGSCSGGPNGACVCSGPYTGTACEYPVLSSSTAPASPDFGHASGSHGVSQCPAGEVAVGVFGVKSHTLIPLLDWFNLYIDSIGLQCAELLDAQGNLGPPHNVIEQGVFAPIIDPQKFQLTCGANQALVGFSGFGDTIDQLDQITIRCATVAAWRNGVQSAPVGPEGGTNTQHAYTSTCPAGFVMTSSDIWWAGLVNGIVGTCTKTNPP